jgi:hypothetical protein
MPNETKRVPGYDAMNCDVIVKNDCSLVSA